jgi:DNA-binding CsgD family transcriptional regulator
MDELDIDRAAFWGWGFGAMNALQFTERRPARAERLVLAQTSTGTGGLNRALAELRQQDDDVQIQTRSHLNTGWTDPENAAGMAHLIKASMGPVELRLFWHGLLWAHEGRTALRVEAPVLFVHAVNDPLFPLDEVRKLAATLPNASFHLIDLASSIAPYQDRAAIEVTKAFLRGVQRPDVTVLNGMESWQRLSKRELEVLRLIAVGKTNDEIAMSLFISTSTVSHHVSNILAKTGAGNRTEAAAFAHRERLL